VELPFHQVLDDLQFAFMGTLGARNDKWSMLADVIYMDLSQTENLRNNTLPGGGSVTVNDTIDLQAWIVSPTVGYVVHSSEVGRVEVLGGLRYFWVDLGIQIDVNDTEVFNESASKDFWDGIVGMRAKFDVGQSWYLPMYFDIGAGDSDFTWQAYAGVGYHFSSFDAVLMYRYLDFEFDNLAAASDLVIKGPLLGAVFKF
jgi:hypothetical protein